MQSKLNVFSNNVNDNILQRLILVNQEHQTDFIIKTNDGSTFTNKHKICS